MSQDEPATPATPTPKRRRWPRRLIVAAVVVVALLLIAEVGLRLAFGFGRPVLFEADPEMEYVAQPSQDLDRNGVRVFINSDRMRSDELARPKPADEFRVLVIGDSVVNGGAHIDQSDLASELLKERLADEPFVAGRRVMTANISQGSWGPGNMQAFLARFGTFEADAIVVVLSDHDAFDARYREGQRPVGSYSLPDRNPLALTEAALKVWYRLRPTAAPPTAQEREDAEAAAAERVRPDLARLLTTLGDAGVPIAIVLHAERDETGETMKGKTLLREAIAPFDFVVIDDGDDFRAAREAGGTPWRDVIHPSAEGQAVLADVLADALRRAFERQAEAPDAPVDNALSP